MIRFLVDIEKHATYMKYQSLEHIMFTRKNNGTTFSLLMIVFCSRSLSAIGNLEIPSGKSFQHWVLKGAKTIQMEKRSLQQMERLFRQAGLSHPTLTQRLSESSCCLYVSMCVCISYLFSLTLGYFSLTEGSHRPDMKGEPVMWLLT